MKDDTSVWPVMLDLVQCLCTELSKPDSDGNVIEPCFCGVLPGDGVLLDYADQGTMGWVRLADGFPTLAFPTPEDSATCNTDWAYTLEIGVAECITTFVDSQGTPPSVEQQFEYTRRQVAAMAAMKRAVYCCLDQGGVTYVIGPYAPMGPEGYVYGGTFSVAVLGA